MRVTPMWKSKLDLAGSTRAGDRRGAGGGSGVAGQRNMAFAGQQARGRVEADPAGAGQIDLGPGVQIGEILGRPAGPSSGLIGGHSWIR